MRGFLSFGSSGMRAGISQRLGGSAGGGCGQYVVAFLALIVLSAILWLAAGL